MHSSVVLVALIAAGCSAAGLPQNDDHLKIGTLPLAPQREISESLYIDIPFAEYGKWGDVDMCGEGSFASGVSIKYSPPGHLDETAINGIKLLCTRPDGHPTGFATSSTGLHGDWYEMQNCTSGYLTGFRANVLQYQGIFTDDVAVEDFEMNCGYGAEIVDALPMAVPFRNAAARDFGVGDWSSFATCSDQLAVCGIRTRYEGPELGDETSVNDVVIFCCDTNFE